MRLGDREKMPKKTSFDTIFSEYRPLLEKQVLAFSEAGTEADASVSEEDMRQEAALALFLAWESYEESRGVTFGAYARVCVRNRLVSLLRRRHTWESVPLDEETVPGSFDDPALRIEDAEGEGSLLSYLRKRLTAREYEVLCVYLDGCSYVQIAQRLGIGEKAVDNAMTRIRAKLRKDGLAGSVRF